MNKGELTDYIATQQSMTKIEAERIINVFTETVASVLSEEQDISLVGFGKFYATKVEAREGRNPQTGETLKIPAHTQPRFSAGEKLKAACNGKTNNNKTKSNSSNASKKSDKKK